MIKNDRQFRIARAQLRAFEVALQDLGSVAAPNGVDPQIIEVQRCALESQLEELRFDVEEYKSLREGEVTHFIITSFADLAKTMIKARIARGFTQRELAERLQGHEQQVQRWEANDYSGASLATLKQIADALSIEVHEELFVPNRKLNFKQFLKNLVKVGIPEELTLRRLLPPHLAETLEGSPDSGTEFRVTFQAATLLSRIFSIQVSELLKPIIPPLDVRLVASTRFKLPSRINPSVVDAYTVYAHYLAACLVSCIKDEAFPELPTDWHEFHQAVTGPDSPITFSKVLSLAWDSGFLVLPLRYSGAFHGAVWQIKGRYVIVIKQTTPLESRWLYDLLHELGHVVLGHVTESQALVEDKPISIENADSAEEDASNEWAENVLFDGESDEVEQACVSACEGRMQQLKAVIPEVARRYNINAGSLSNHMANRLRMQGENWWGTAQNLQKDGVDPFGQARDVLLQRLNLNHLSSLDRELMMRALTEE